MIMFGHLYRLNVHAICQSIIQAKAKNGNLFQADNRGSRNARIIELNFQFVPQLFNRVILFSNWQFYAFPCRRRVIIVTQHNRAPFA